MNTNYDQFKNRVQIENAKINDDFNFTNGILKHMTYFKYKIYVQDILN